MKKTILFTLMYCLSASTVFSWTLTQTNNPTHGVITSDPAGIDCGKGHSVCSHEFPDGTVVTLSTVPDAGYEFVTWSETVTNNWDYTATAIMTEDISYSTSFYPAYELHVIKPEHGTITANGINCGTKGNDCFQYERQNHTLRLVAEPDHGYIANTWVGTGLTIDPDNYVATTEMAQDTDDVSHTFQKVTAQNNNVWLHTAGIWNNNDNQTPEQAQEMAKFDIVVFARLNFGAWNDYCGYGRCIYENIKTYNPDVKLFTYYAGGGLYSTNDDYSVAALNGLGRWNVSRGHSMGSVYGDNEMNLLEHKDGQLVEFETDRWFLLPSKKLGEYLAEAVVDDLLTPHADLSPSNRIITEDGIHFDNMMIREQYLPTDNFQTSEDNAQGWLDTWAELVPELHKHGLKIWTNSGSPRFEEDAQGWDYWIENGDILPDFVFEEDAWVIEAGTGDIQFLSPEQVKSALPRYRKMLQKTNVVFGNYLGPYWSTNESGTDNQGRTVTRDWIFQYTFGCFCLVKNNNAYLSMHYGSADSPWLKPFQKANLGDWNLGKAGASYRFTTLNGHEVIIRRFEKGDVIVNNEWVDIPATDVKELFSYPVQVVGINDAYTKEWDDTLPEIKGKSALILRHPPLPKIGSSLIQ